MKNRLPHPDSPSFYRHLFDLLSRAERRESEFDRRISQLEAFAIDSTPVPGPAPAPVPVPTPAPNPAPAPGGVGGTTLLPMGFSSADVGVLTFQEEFDAPINPAKWRGELGYQSPATASDFMVANSRLYIWNTIASGTTWRSGRAFNTDGPGNQYGNASGADTFRFGQRYGVFECRCKLPTGKSNWPAFWLYAHDGTQRPEIDIMEYFGGDINYNSGPSLYQPRNYAGTYHDGTDGATSIQGQRKLFDTLGYVNLNAFHNYAVEWTPSGVEWFFDGQSIGSTSNSPDTELFIIISMGTQQGISYTGAAYTEPDGTTSNGPGNAFEVEFIRAWGLPGGGHSVVGTYAGP